jgi:LAO/AO transport system ATPase
MIAALLDRLRHRDRNALARLLSLAANGDQLAEIESGLLPSPPGRGAGVLPSHPGRRAGGEGNPNTRVIAFTGSGGVGKSSLIGKLIPLLRTHNHKVAVLACDPQSPLTGGALLGDRFRMGSSIDDGVFIRSLAAKGGHGVVADHLELMLRLLETFGFDVILLETVGAGQGDVEVRNLADVVVLLLQPESGDDVQWEKAGILECADVIVIHKADLPTAEQTAAQVRAALDLSPSSQTQVVRVSTKANQGHAELWQAIEVLPLRRQRLTGARLLLRNAVSLLEDRFDEADPKLQQLVEAWQRGEKSTASAAVEMAQYLAR